MKISYLKIGILILALFLQSCGYQKQIDNDTNKVSKISIQIFPIFYTHSLIICDVKNGEMIFDMIGDVRFIKENSNYDIKPFYFKFNPDDSSLLADSILGAFKERDFSDSFLDYEDGIGTEILFIFNDGASKKIELSNSSTDNQSELITFLLETVINNCEDSTTIAYSELLQNYFK